MKTEFPAPPSPTSMSMFYRGGTYVPAGQTATPVDATPIPTSGTIRMGEFRGQTKVASGGVVSTFTATGANKKATIPGTPLSCTVTMMTDGTINYTNSVTGSGAVSTKNPGWYNPQTTSIGSSYWVKATISTAAVNGTFSGASTSGTWIQMSSNVGWTLTCSSTSVEATGSLAISVSATNGGTVIGTGTFGFDCGYTP